MHDLQDPRELGLAKVFQQAQMLARQTTRATNPDWYRSAIELDRQWHILIDGRGRLASHVHDRRSGLWVEGPEIGDDLLRDSDPSSPGWETRVDSHLQCILQDDRLGCRPRSLGVVVQVADEMAIADLSAEFSGETDFERIRAALEESPRQVIADSTLNLDALAWKILPLWGMRHGDRRSIAILLNRRMDRFLRRVSLFGEERNLPVVPQVLSAPLSVLSMLPHFLPQNSPEGDIVLLHYPRLTVLVVLDPAAEILQLRALPHRHELDFPHGIGEVVGNAAACMNLKAPKVYLLSLGGANSEGLLMELMTAGCGAEEFGIGMLEPAPAHLSLVPQGRPELMLASPPAPDPGAEPGALCNSQSFQELAGGWGAQNFDRQSCERMALFPSRSELVLLKLIDKAKVTFATLALCVSLIATYEGAGISGKTAKQANQVTLNAMRAELEELAGEDRRIAYWESMMKPRSEGWSILEVVLRMIPPDGSILLTSCEYAATGEPPRNRANKKIGFQREWKLKGYCRSNARAALTQLSSSRYVHSLFDDIAADYSREAFRSNEKSRSLSVTMQQHQGDYPPNGILAANAARLYSTCFDIRVAQAFGDKDDLALLIAPPRSAEAEGGAK